MRAHGIGAIIVVLIMGVALGTACVRPEAKTEAKGDPFGSLTIDQVDALINAHEASIFDDNSKARYQKNHVPTAKWVAYDHVTAADLPTDKNRQLVFYCANEL